MYQKIVRPAKPILKRSADHHTKRPDLAVREKIERPGLREGDAQSDAVLGVAVNVLLVRDDSNAGGLPLV